MKTYQAWNPKNKSWVKYKFCKDKGFKVVDVKTREPWKPFKGISKRGRKKW